MFRGGVANSTVQLIRVNLVNNTARYGGGLSLAFYDDTSSNNVTIVDSEVTGNVALLAINNIPTPPTSGGGPGPSLGLLPMG